MERHPSISALLLTEAESADKATAKELTKAAKKLDSFSRAPGSRKDVARMAAVLTPAVVDALGRAFVAVRTAEIDTPHPVFGQEYKEADHSFGALLIAAEDPALRDVAAARLDEVFALMTRMNSQQIEHINYLATEDTEQEKRFKQAAREFIEKQPLTVAEQWSQALGLDLPREYWDLSMVLKVLDPESPVSARADAHILAGVRNFPGDKSQFSIRIGAFSMNMLGDETQRREESGRTIGSYSRPIRDSDEVLEGFVTPAASPFEFPRVIAEIMAAHPGLEYDFAKLRLTGAPGRLATPARKKRVREWLAGEFVPGA